jgi:hypothetical protein
MQLNCQALLTLASQREVDEFHFGHPPRPELKLFCLKTTKRSTYLVLAHTPHHVCAQVFVSDQVDASNQPRILLSVQESITSVCIVPLEEENSEKPEVWSPRGSPRNNVDAALVICVGTNAGQVYTCKVTLGRRGFGIHDVCQPLPYRVSFHPRGGVTSMVVSQSADFPQRSFVWISYGDGTLLRLPPHLLTYVVELDDDNQPTSDPPVISDPTVIKAKVFLPPESQGESWVVVPFETKNPFQTLLVENDEEGFSALVYPVNASAVGLGSAPTLSIYTSEYMNNKTAEEKKELEEDGESELLNVAIDATSTLIRGVAGVVKWGLRRQVNDPESSFVEENEEHNAHTPILAQVYQPPNVKLTASYEFHDAPRQLTSVSVCNTLAAAMDNLGRVQLIDLSALENVRLLKGVRDAEVAWKGDDMLVIHSRQRRSVEAYQMVHGPRILSMQVHSRDAQLVSCMVKDRSRHGNPESSCFLLEEDDSNSSSTCILKELIVDPLQASRPTSPVIATPKKVTTPQPRTSSAKKKIPLSSPSPEKAIKLQLLQQMLSDTRISCTKEDVFATLQKINNLRDLCTALDLIATSAALKDRMNVISSEFQKLAMDHCQNVLRATTEGKGPDVTESAPVKSLRSYIAYYTQLIGAYDVLNNFEQRMESDIDEDDTRINPKSAWAVEGLAWLTVYEQVHSQSLDAEIPSRPLDEMSFSSFAKCCVGATQTKTQKSKAGERHIIVFSDSSKTRKEILSHVFRPLLKDAFSFNVVDEIFEKLSILDEDAFLEKYMGEWYMTIPVATATHKSFFAVYSPISRWLQGRAARCVDKQIECSEPLPEILMEDLYMFCSESVDLVRAFLLACATRDAISKVVSKREAKTYGKVWKSQAVAPWESLLRKLRVSLLISLRLNGIPLGPFPITVKTLEDPSIFSVYQLVARDELRYSNKHEEIVALELACKGSGQVFDPSTSVGDDPSRWRLLQQACLASESDELERAEYLMDLDHHVQGALLLYLSSHNNSAMLCAHRALQMAHQWIEEPSRNELLRDCVDALAGLSEEGEYRVHAGAVRLEVWQSCIRPVFRAFLFGFDHAHEIQEEVYAPLMQNLEWMVRVGKAGLSILSLLERTELSNTPNQDKKYDASCWPPVRTDFILNQLVDKTRPVDKNALDVHRVIVSGCMVSNDVETLSQCVSGFYEAFDNMSLLQAAIPAMGDSGKQMQFLEHAIIYRADTLKKPVLDRFELDEIETLAILWSIDVRDVRTIFLLAMYEMGKDTTVDELVTRMSSQRGIDVARFLEDGVGIVCRRLHQMLHVKRSREIRSLLGLVDADTDEWIREQAEITVSLLEDYDESKVILEVPLQLTHFLVLRLMSLAVSHADKETRIKLHSLSVLTGTLLKETEKANR